MRLRQAESSDLANVQSIVAAAYAPYVPLIGRRPMPMDEDYPARIAAGSVWITEGEPPEGLVVVADRREGLWLDNFAVTPQAQGGGLGRMLLAEVEQIARARGHGRVSLLTNARFAGAIRFYVRAGYRETFRRTEYGFDRIYMEKRL
ncbi:GNAT family N-acetyltransferase [Palleronia caenipelagi]|nr:GNAT family N-acetyltransferase [Palleronia caenipelagi]